MATANSLTSPSQSIPNPSLPSQPAQLQLHDIHVPDEVSNFPIAPGWWLLLAIAIIGAVWFYKRFKQNKHLNANKNRALEILANNPNFSSKACIALLKGTAMQYFSRQQLAKLYGSDFKDFLMNQLPEQHQNHFNKLITPAFQAQYQAVQHLDPASDSDCQLATKLWLDHALPVKEPLAIKESISVIKSSVTNKATSVEKKQELSA